MAIVMDDRTVYVDDSGTDSKSRIAAAAFCVSTVERWKAFERRWRNIATNAGFSQFHMTEFAACRPDKPCNQCMRGQTNSGDHPWQRWTPKERRQVLQKLAGAVVEHVECGFGIAHVKEDYEKHVINSPARQLITDPLGDQHFTHAVQKCGGELAKWRAENKLTDAPLKFVFDLASPQERDEIARIFFGAASGRPQFVNGVEQWFIPTGVSYESRKLVIPLLAADMLAWVTATFKARETFYTGEVKEMFQLAEVFVETQIRMGYTSRETVMQWEKDIINAAQSKGMSDIRSDDGITAEGAPQRDNGETGSGEIAKAKKAEG